MSEAQTFLAFLLLLGALAAGLRLVSRDDGPVPYEVVLAAAGVVLGLVPGLPLPRVEPDLILLAFVPALVFEAALTLDLAELWRRALAVGLLATLGVLMTVLLLGWALHGVLRLPWPAAFLVAAIVAPTDPVAVVGIVRRLRAPAGAAAILEGESLFNDGTGVALFAAVLASIATGAPSIGDAAARFLLITTGGTAVGLAVGVVAVALLRLARAPETEILLTLVAAYGSYLAADLLGWSGVAAVVCAGLAAAYWGGRRGEPHGTQLLGFWNLLAFVLNAVLFVLVGAALPTLRVLALAGPVLAAWLLMVATRAVPVYALLAAADPRGRRIPWRWRHLAFWGGIRGALSVALALAAGHSAAAGDAAVIAYGMVVLSLLLQGGLAVPVARALAR